MATVTGLTKEAMEAIRDGVIVDADVVGNNLILTKFDATTIDAGNVRGPVGPASPAKVTALPGSPTDEDAVILQTAAMAALSPAISWHCKYESASGKWEVIGGAEMYSRQTINQNAAASATMYELSTGSPATLTAPVAGSYDVIYGATGQENNGAAVRADIHMQLYKNGSGIGILEEAWAVANGGYDKWMIENKSRITLAANDVIRPRGMITSANYANFYWKTSYIRLQPVTLG